MKVMVRNMLKYSKIHRLMVFVMALIIVLNIAGCSEKKPNTIIKPEQVVPSVENNDVPDEQPEFLKNVYPTSIRITNTETVLKPGKYKLKAEVSPENAIKGCRFSLVENCSYAQITDDLLIIGKDAPENARITIKASSKYDPQISSTKMFTVSNEIDWIDIATEEQLFAISDNLKGNYRLVNDIYLTKPWAGIGIADTTVDGKKNSGKGFSGRLDGSGFTVYGLDMTDGKGYNKAFFYQIEDGAIIENLSLKGAVHGSSWCGALVGINKGLIKNCLTSVEVKTAAAPCAAFVGTNKGTILNCLALGSATAGYSSAGHGAGFVNVNEGTIKYSYALADTIEFVDGYKKKVYGAILKSEADLKSKVTYSEWDDNVWYIVSGAYPCLRHDGFVPGNNDNNDSNKKPDDNENVIWTDISTEDELKHILNDLNGNYRLTNDIKLTKAWNGIGKPASGSDKGVSFNGRFNGNGYSISGFSMEDPNGFNMGFFMQTGSEAIIENLRLLGSVSGRNYCSALVGINNGVVRNCVAEVDVTGKSAPSSGLVGTNNGKIINCYALGQVTVKENDKHGAGFVNVNSAAKGSIESSFALNSSMKYAIGYNKVNDVKIQKSKAQLQTAETFTDWNTDVWYITDKMYPVLKYPDFQEADVLPQSVTIVDCNETLSPGNYILQTKVYPERAPQDTELLLTESVNGVKLEENVLTIDSSVEDGAIVKIKVVSAYNSMIYATIKLFVSSVVWTDISTEDELRRISDDLNGNYRLTSDIKLTKAWSGIGKPASGSDKGVSFNGRFNGNGYSISGFSMEDPNGFNMGFFMQTGSEAIIEKVKLEGTVKGRNYCSALVGINNGVVKNCIVNVAVSGKSVPSSGFVGTNNGMIAYCLAVGSVSVVNNGKHGAGFVNTIHATKGKIVSSYALDSSMPYAIGYNMGKNTDVTKTDAELKTADTYKDWDSNIWYISNGTYPIFRTQVFRRALNNQCIDFMPEQVAGGFLDDFSCGISMDLWNISKRKWGSLEGYKGALPESLSYTNDGVLRLKVQGNASSDIPLSGAVLVSKQTCGAGSYSICMKPASVLGVCNALWTFCYGDAGAINHEIDIELPGHITDKAEGTVGSDIGYHRILTTNWLSLNNKTSVGTKLANPSNDGDWHVYRFDWHTEPEPYIDFFVDGNRINTSRTNVPTKKGLLWFGIWLPKEWCGLPDFDNAYMLVDWISYQPFDEHTEDSICDPGKIADISEYPSMESTIS